MSSVRDVEAYTLSESDRKEVFHWKQKYRRHRKDPYVLFNLATAYYYAGVFEQSAKYYLKCAKIKSDLRNEALYYLALSYIEINKYDKAHRIFKTLARRKIPRELKGKVKDYLQLFKEQEEAKEEKRKLSFLESLDLSVEVVYGQNSNPEYENDGEEESDKLSNITAYGAYKLLNGQRNIINIYTSKYIEQYSTLSTSDNMTTDLGLNYYLLRKKGYYHVNPYISTDEDDEAETFSRKGVTISYSKGDDDTYAFNYYTTSSDDEDLDSYTGKTYELSMTNMFSEKQNEFRYTTIKVFKNDLNDTDTYFNSNQGIDILTGISIYYPSSELSATGRFTYREYIEDKSLGIARYDKTYAITGRFKYDINQYFSAVANASYSVNGSNWEGIEDYDPTYSMTIINLGIIGNL